jgi:hypothetical protein
VKIDIEGFYGPEEFALLGEFFTKLAATKGASLGAYAQPGALIGVGLGSGLLAQTTTDEDKIRAALNTDAVETHVSEAPAKRTRRTKAQIEADTKAAEAQAPAVLDKAANISTTPEDRQDPADATEVDDEPETTEGDDQPDFFDGDDEEEAEDDDLIDGYAVTDEGLKAVMHAYVAKFDMIAAQTHAKTLFGGYTKRSEVTAAGPAALATAIRNFANAINAGKAA